MCPPVLREVSAASSESVFQWLECSMADHHTLSCSVGPAASLNKQQTNSVLERRPRGLQAPSNSSSEAIPDNSINLAEPDGFLPLQLACESCSLGVVRYLIGIIGECSSLCDENDNYLLHYACRGGNVDVVGYLLKTEHLRTVSLKNKDGQLPIDVFKEFVQENPSEERDVEYVDVIRHLLLADPEIVQDYCGNKK
eukprot:scaffold1235_cov25-Cyclotella_meneghiniana.AAC.4